jgi:hypothetical protein
MLQGFPRRNHIPMIAWLLKKVLGVEPPSYYLGSLFPQDLDRALKQQQKES